MCMHRGAGTRVRPPPARRSCPRWPRYHLASKPFSLWSFQKCIGHVMAVAFLEWSQAKRLGSEVVSWPPRAARWRLLSRPRSRRYGARASNSALASLKCIQSLTIRCCLMHSATCSHPWRREVNRKCVVSIDTSILSTSACAFQRSHNVAACLVARFGWLILLSLPQESSIAWGTTCPTRQSKVPPTSGSRKVALRHHRPKSCESLEDGRIGVPKHRFRAFLMRIHRVAMAQAFVHFPVHLLASWVRHFDQQRRQNHRLTFLAFSQKCQKCQK